MRGNENLEITSNPEVEQARDFFVEQIARMTSLSTDALRKKTLRELLNWYKDAINADPTPEQFKSLMERLDGKNGQRNEGTEVAFKEFLSAKLPKEVVSRMVQRLHVRSIKDVPLKEIEKVHAEREELGIKMRLGFHVATNEYTDEVPVSAFESVTVANGQDIVVPPGNAHYSITEKGLYKEVLQRSGGALLYLIEGSTGDFTNSNQAYRDAHRPKGWISTARKLPIISKIELTPAVAEALGTETQ